MFLISHWFHEAKSALSRKWTEKRLPRLFKRGKALALLSASAMIATGAVATPALATESGIGAVTTGYWSDQVTNWGTPLSPCVSGAKVTSSSMNWSHTRQSTFTVSSGGITYTGESTVQLSSTAQHWYDQQGTFEKEGCSRTPNNPVGYDVPATASLSGTNAAGDTVSCSSLSGTFDRTNVTATVTMTGSCTATMSGQTGVSSTSTIFWQLNVPVDVNSGGEERNIAGNYYCQDRTECPHPPPPPPPPSACDEEPAFIPDGPTGPEWAGNCLQDRYDGENVNSMENGETLSSPASAQELSSLFGVSVSPNQISSLSSTALSDDPPVPGSGFGGGACRSNATCDNLGRYWSREHDIDEKDTFYNSYGNPLDLTVYTGGRLNFWMIPTIATGNDRYDFLTSDTELNAPEGPVGICMIKHVHSPVISTTGVPQRLDDYPSTVGSNTNPSTSATMSLSAPVGPASLSYSHNFTSADGYVIGKKVADGSKEFWGTWTSTKRGPGNASCEWNNGAALSSGVAYVYPEAPARPPGKNYTFGGRRTHTKTG